MSTTSNVIRVCNRKRRNMPTTLADSWSFYLVHLAQISHQNAGTIFGGFSQQQRYIDKNKLRSVFMLMTIWVDCHEVRLNFDFSWSQKPYENSTKMLIVLQLTSWGTRKDAAVVKWFHKNIARLTAHTIVWWPVVAFGVPQLKLFEKLLWLLFPCRSSDSPFSYTLHWSC